MDNEVLNYAVEKTRELISAPSCCSEAKAAAQTWLDAIGTEKESSETKKYIDELEEDIMPIDSLIGFAESDDGIRIFGADTAKNIAAHANQIKSDGAKYCDCPACASVAAILEKKEILLT
ncbi:molecular chaperone Hsp90 [Lachnospiraceae bacterium 54-53]